MVTFLVPDSQIIHRDLKPQAASRVAWAVIFVCACGAWGSVPAHASMIYSGESMAVDPFLTSINGTCSAAEPSFEWYSFESRRGDEVAGSMPKSSPVSVPISPPSRSEQLPVETPFLGVEVSSSTGASGAGTVGSSSVGGASSFSAAIFCGHTELSPPTLVGWLRACDDRDIPPAPPFELLRPPKILTIFA